MTNLQKTFLQMQIGNVLSRKQELEWLVQQGVQAASVANFGCHIGGETLALVWALGANEAVGVDEDEQAILQARDTLKSIRDEIKRINLYHQHYSSDVSEDDKAWWSDSVPDFFKKDLLHEKDISFLVRDITEPTGLPSGYYVVTYCDFVLHHIWYDAEREDARGDTAFAVGEMARVTKPGGVVAISELIQYANRQRLDFTVLFQEAELELEYASEWEVEGAEERGTVAKYLCGKPLSNGC